MRLPVVLEGAKLVLKSSLLVRDISVTPTELLEVEVELSLEVELFCVCARSSTSMGDISL